jgi:hypothetical protein
MVSIKLLVVIFALAPILAIADGLPLREGRYPGEVLVFRLTPKQKQVINHYRTCQLERANQMNVYTPYVFSLTSKQAAAVRKRMGFTPSYFLVFETVRGFNDAGPFWNLVLRYSEDSFEIPVDLLLADSEARKAHDEQGWERQNPCFPKMKLK